MNFTTLKKITLLITALFLLLSLTEIVSTAQRLQSPILIFTGTESFQQGGKEWTRYNYEVDNFTAYPNDLFAGSPDLPPCGNNTKAARMWVDIYAQGGTRLNGFCALGVNSDLRKIWFALESSVLPPSWVYVELNDRKTNTKYKSLLTDTVQ